MYVCFRSDSEALRMFPDEPMYVFLSGVGGGEEQQIYFSKPCEHVEPIPKVDNKAIL